MKSTSSGLDLLGTPVKEDVAESQGISAILPILSGPILVAAGYYAGSRLGFAFTFHPYPVSTLWPPNAILLSALLLSPVRNWSMLLLAALPVHLAIQVQSDVPLGMAMCWYVSNCCEALIGAGLFRRFHKSAMRLSTFQEVSIFLSCVVFAGPFFSSFIDCAFVRWNNWGTEPYWVVWRMRFFSNVLAQLTLAPAILLWAKPGSTSSLRKPGLTRGVEAFAMMTGLSVAAIAVFYHYEAGPDVNSALVYIPLPFLIWSAVRLSSRWLSVSILLVAFVAIWGAVHGRGPFNANAPAENAFAIQAYLILVSIPLYFLAAALEEGKLLVTSAQEKEERLSLALSAAEMGTWDWQIRSNHMIWSEETKEMFGVTGSKDLGVDDFFQLVYPDDRENVRRAIEEAIARGSTYEVEFRVVPPGSETRWVMGKGEVFLDESGKPVRMLGVNVNITRRKKVEEALRNETALKQRFAGRMVQAQEEERGRIARDLHDGVNQEIAALSIFLSSIKRKVSSSTSNISQELSDLQQKILGVADEIRRTSHELHPGVLQHAGLTKAVQGHCEEFSAQSKLPVTLNLAEGLDQVPTGVALCTYRVIQEALHNIAAHARATLVIVGLRIESNLLMLHIEDNGCGFDVEEAKKHSGLGLISLDERIRLLNGKLAIDSKPEQGTRIDVAIPL